MGYLTKSILILTLIFLAKSALAFDALPARVPTNESQIQLSFAPVVKKAAPAVVNIYTRKVVHQRLVSPFLNDPFFQHFFGGQFPEGQTRERLENSLGSGVIVAPDGTVITSNHVIDGADEITVVLADRREFAAKVVMADKNSDLAVLKVETKEEKLPFLEIKDSDDVEVGDLVMAIGNPFGVGQTVTTGIVSAQARTALGINDVNYFIQTDAAINPGNSGGALVTMDSKLIGINAAIYSRDGGNMGIGFAVPSNMVSAVLHSIKLGQTRIVRPWIGLSGQPVTADLAVTLRLDRPAGLLVNGLHEASPAKKAGVKVGDVIIEVAGKSIDDPATFTYRLMTLPEGKEAQITVLRKGEKLSYTVERMPPPEKPVRDERVIDGPSALSGARVMNLSPAIAQEYGLEGREKGVVIIDTKENSIAARFGLLLGDVVLEVNGENILSTQQLVQILKNKRSKGTEIILDRDSRRMKLIIR